MSNFSEGRDAGENAGTLGSDVRRMATDAGATICGTVHKKVRALVATREAADQGTQRVRQAISRGVPVVGEAWLAACIARGQLLDPRLPEWCLTVDPQAAAKAAGAAARKAVILQEKTFQGGAPSDKKGKGCKHQPPPRQQVDWLGETVSAVPKDPAKEAAFWAGAVKVDLGPACSCACHDDDDGTASCSWCEAAH